jgi:hypothetical protein
LERFNESVDVLDMHNTIEKITHLNCKRIE